MVERQPADNPIIRGERNRLANGADIGEQLFMAQNHPLRGAGAARGVLQKGDVIRLDGRWPEIDAVAHQLCGSGNGLQAGHLSLKQPSKKFGLGNRDQVGRPGIIEDTDMTMQVILKLRGAYRRIDGERHTACHEDAIETE